jgi:hypothetical protein
MTTATTTTEYDTHCERCRVVIDPATAYRQTERMRWGGKTIAVTAHYCESCCRVLKGVGAGEHSAMQERAGERPSYEPAYKADE